MPKATKENEKKDETKTVADGRNQLQGSFPAGGILSVHCPSLQSSRVRSTFSVSSVSAAVNAYIFEMMSSNKVSNVSLL